jgi:outer membrane protein assembly factor BamB
LAWTSDRPPQDFLSADRACSTGTAYSTPVLCNDDRSAIFLSWRGMTSADVTTGTVDWRFDWIIEPAGGMPDPVVADNLVCMSWAYDPSFNPAGFLLRLTEGGTSLVWKTPDLVTVGPAPVILDGYIYTLHFGLTGAWAMPIASLQCLDLATGKVVWEEPGERREGKMLALTAANKTLVILDDRGTLSTAAASPEGFEEIARCDVLAGAARSRQFWTPPVLCNAKIYCRNFAGDLVCIDVHK